MFARHQRERVRFYQVTPFLRLINVFWRGFRGDELTHLQVEYVELAPGEGMTCYFPQTKGDRQYKGSSFKI